MKFISKYKDILIPAVIIVGLFLLYTFVQAYWIAVD